MNIIFFDTNALTGIYSYSLNSIKEIVSAFEDLEKTKEFRVVVPATVYEEYKRHYHKSRSRSGDKYPLSVFRNNFNQQKGLITGRLSKIRNIKLSTIFSTNIDILIDKYQSDTHLYLQQIEKELKDLEDNASDDEINDSNDILFKFVESHKLPPLSLEKKLIIASKADVRFSQNIKPGLSDQNKKEDYPFQKYGDVFIWYEILENVPSGDNAIFIENETKDDWWEEKKGNKIAHELEEEFVEKLPGSQINMLSFDAFYSSYLESLISNSETKVEISQVRDKLNDYLNGTVLLSSLENEIQFILDDQDIDDYFVGEPFKGGNISELTDVEIHKVTVNNQSFFSSYDSDDGTINIRCEAYIFISCFATVEFDKDSIPSIWKIQAKIKADVMAVYDLILNNEIISSVLNDESHEFLSHEIIKEENFDMDDNDTEVGLYGNCTSCSEPINDDNYGDGTLCHQCIISEED